MVKSRKIKTSELDRVFSKYVRLLADGRCRRCGHTVKKLDCAHFHGRGDYSIRWDLDNVTALCMGCHGFLDSNPLEKIEFFMEKLGTERYNALNARRNNHDKVDRELLLAKYKAGIKDLENADCEAI